MMFKITKLFVIGILFLNSFYFSFSQIKCNNFTINLITKENDLPENYVYRIIQANDGYLWIGTQGGLSKFDGQNFQHFNNRNLNENTVNDFDNIFQDEGGKLWFSTFNEIGYIFQNKFFKFYSLKKENKFFEFFSKDSLNRLIFGFSNNISIINNNINNNNNNKFKELFSLNDRSIKLNYLFSNKKFKENFISHSKGLIITDENYEILKNFDLGFQFNKIGYWDNNLIVATEKGIYFIFKNNGEWNLIKSNLNINIFDFQIDKENQLIGINEKKIVKVSKNPLNNLSFKFIENSDFLITKYVSIFIDIENTIWVSSSDGILKITKTLFNNSILFKNKTTNSIYFKDNKSIVGTAHNGVFIFSENKKIYLLKKSQIIFVYIDSKNRDWFSTVNDLFLYENNKLTKILINNKSLKKVHSIAEDENGNFIFQYKDSIVFYKNKNNFNIVKIDKLKGNIHIRLIYPTKKFGLVFGTNRGLFLLKNKKFVEIENKPLFDSPYIYDLYEDKKENLWIGTDEGMFLYKDKKFQKLSIEDGLHSNWVSNIQIDKNNYLWLANDGVCRIKIEDLTNYWNKKSKELNIEYFGIEDGMPETNLPAGYQHTGFMDDSGNIWYCTMKGLCRVNPMEIKKNTNLPNPIIEKVFIDDVEKDIYKPLNINPNEMRVEFKYTAPTFINNSKIMFKTRLVGYYNVWKLRKKREISYTNLSPGDYSFQVMVSNSDGLWNDKIAEFKFNVIRPFYLTWWFFIICGIVAFILINYLIKFIKYLIQSAMFMQKSKFVGPYKIIEQIGLGGMGSIYKAISLESKKIVALKVLNEIITDKEMKKRFVQEGLICEQIDHPNIVKIYGRGEDKDRLYFAMEYCNGSTLREAMAEGELPVLKCLWVTSVIIDVLHDIHSKGIVHRDIKPENIMLTNNFNLSTSRINNKLLPNLKSSLKLLDFGLAKTIGNTALTKTGLLAGTVYYLPPECIQTKKDWYPEIDFYSTGVLLYEMLTKTKPFDGEDLMEVMYKILEYTPVTPKKIDVRIPKEVSEFTDSLLIKDTMLRLKDYKEIRKQLDVIINQTIEKKFNNFS